MIDEENMQPKQPAENSQQLPPVNDPGEPTKAKVEIQRLQLVTKNFYSIYSIIFLRALLPCLFPGWIKFYRELFPVIAQIAAGLL